MFAIGVTVGLAEWIIDDSCLVSLNLIQRVREKMTRYMFALVHAF